MFRRRNRKEEQEREERRAEHDAYMAFEAEITEWDGELGREMTIEQWYAVTRELPGFRYLHALSPTRLRDRRLALSQCQYNAPGLQEAIRQWERDCATAARAARAAIEGAGSTREKGG